MTHVRFPIRSAAAVVLAFGLSAIGLSAQTTTRQTPPPAPKPFPQPGQASASAPVTAPSTPASAAQTPASTPAPAGLPTEASLGVPWYPTAQFLGSYDAGRGQRLYLFGTNASFLDIVAYYRNVMKKDPKEIFKAPATAEFDLPNVKWVEEAMAFVPGVTVKDYTWGGSDGYLFVEGTKSARFKTIIQIVPAPVR